MPEPGFQNETLKRALQEALAGRPAELERLLARLGAVIASRPNLRLAAAFGAEVADVPDAAPLLKRLGDEDAAPDTDRAFLPIAAAHGWAARVRAGRDVNRGWAALAGLAADERAAVRVGTLDALVGLARVDGGAATLIARATGWLDDSDREVRFGTAAVVSDVLSDARVFASIKDPAPLLAYLDRAIAEIADAPRSAERSDGRRRLLLGLSGVLRLVAKSNLPETRTWFEATCENADHPDVRKVLSDTIVKLATGPEASSKAEELRKTLEESAKPLRDPTRLRAGTGRGKASRRTR
ncbi:MAG TPA: hypothetical protein VGG33_14910 [Polyangia bacterium]